MVMKKPKMKDDFCMISAKVISAVCEIPMISVPIIKKNVITTEITAMSRIFEIRNSALLKPLMTFCLIVLNVNSLVISTELHGVRS